MVPVTASYLFNATNFNKSNYKYSFIETINARLRVHVVTFFKNSFIIYYNIIIMCRFLMM